MGTISFSSVQADERPEQPGEPYAKNWNTWGTGTDTTLDGNVILDGTTYSTRTFAGGTKESPATYTLDGGGFVVDGGATASSNGYHALRFYDYTSCSIRNVTFQNCCREDYDGGAIKQDDGEITLSGTNTFSGNSGGWCGGAICGDSVTISGGTNTFSGNTADLGGAIYGDYYGVVTISNGTNTFSGNSTSGFRSGGAIFGNVTISGGTNTLSGNTTTGNQSSGAIYGINVTISGGTNTFSGNTTTGNQSSGAIYGINNVTISGGTNTFSGNTATGNFSSGGAICGDSVTISGGTNTFSGNSASEFCGVGGVAMCAGVTISGGTNTFSGNSAERGGVFYSESKVRTITISGGTTIFEGNTDVNGNNDITSYSDIYNGCPVIINGGTCYFGGGIDSLTLEISKGTTATGPTVTFGPGSQTFIYHSFTVSDANLTIDLGTAPESLKTINPNFDTKTPTSFYTSGLSASGSNNLTVYATITEPGEWQNVITTGYSIDNTTFNSFTSTIILGKGAAEGVYGTLELSDDGTDLIVKIAKAEEDAKVFNMLDKKGGDSVNVAYYDKTKTSTPANQEIVATISTNEPDTTVLHNDDSKSTLKLQSNSADVRKVASPVDTDGKTLKPTFQNTEGTTYLTVNSIEFDGYAINAGKNQDVHLSGQYITMNPTSNVLRSDVIVTAQTFYLDNAEVTFVDSKVDADMITNTASKLTIGADSTKADSLTVTGSIDVNGSTINIDLFGPGSNDFLSIGTTAALDDVLFNFTEKIAAKEGDVYDLLTAGTLEDFTNLSATFDKYTGTYKFVKNGNILQLVLGEPVPPTPVPEPSTWALLILGTAGLVWLRRRKK